MVARITANKMPPPPRDPPPPYTAAPAPLTDSAVGAAHRIVVGFDFGTTFTGVSWVSTDGAHAKTVSDVHCINDWPGPGRDGDYSWKTPSRIAYGGDNNSAVDAWGFEVLPRMKSFSWMKLLLDQEQLTKFDDPGLTASEGNGVLQRPIHKKPVEICADFISKVTAFAYASLAKRFSPEVLEASPIDFWFTVPAVWSDKAKADTLTAARKAAKMANIKIHHDSNIFLIREPEAAVVAALSLLIQGGSDRYIKINDGVLICDCSGGTVDLTAYTITAIAPRLEFKELISGAGGKCGSTYIDREFIMYMEAKFGNAYRSLDWSKRGPASRFMKDFEGHKRDFGKSENTRQVYEMQLCMRNAPSSEYYDDEESTVRITYHDMQTIFDRVISKILVLLQDQLDRELRSTGTSIIKTIILVGGFGDSAYLNKSLRFWCSPRGVRLICPEHPQSAIVRGAAFAGLQHIQPSSRCSRLHYGFAFHKAFDPERHRIRDRFIWDWDGTARAKNQMGWQLEKGANVDQDTNIEFTAEFSVFEDSVEQAVPLTVYSSELDDAPHNARMAGVRELAVIWQDLARVNMTARESRLVGGRIMKKVKCDYTVHFGHRQGVLVFSCKVDGQEVGNTSVVFNSQGEQAHGSRRGRGGSGSPRCAMQ